MKGWSALLFAIGVIGVVAGCIWLNTAVLCLGDIKFDQGCGGFPFYFVLWSAFSAPLAVAAGITAARTDMTPLRRTLFLVASILVIGFTVQLAWTVLPDDDRGLVAMYLIGGVALAIAYLVARMPQHRRSGRDSTRPVV